MLSLLLSALTLSVVCAFAVPYNSFYSMQDECNTPSTPGGKVLIMPMPMSSSSPPPTTASVDFIVKTVTATETTTVEAQPSTTRTSSVIVTPSTTATNTVAPNPNFSSWTSPSIMKDLDPFNITYFPSGRQNVHIVHGVPASADVAGFAPLTTNKAAAILNNSFIPKLQDKEASVLQLFYPEGSINPAQKPQGGAEFYASPLDLRDAQHVSLQYDVFFPEDFAWVKAGKLPGLYGGHTSCSGGSSALSCFSTRLMWRQCGAGELYLYAPKDKQTDALCADPGSVCDGTYGFSVGRGSFHFTPGVWTTVLQQVVLNTPGGQDGIFTLDFDGRRVINRTDIFYRSAPSKSTLSQRSLDVFLSILDLLWRRSDVSQETDVFQTRTSRFDSSPHGKPVGFTGLFFSTFFGGHEDYYATPKDQYTWFRNFNITRYD